MLPKRLKIIMHTIFQKIETQIKNIDYKPKYVTLSTTYKSVDDKLKEMGLEPCYVDDIDDKRVYVT